MSLVVRHAALADILPLRHAILRPGKPVEAAVFDRDDEAVHVGAWDGDVLVGCATVLPDPWAGLEGCPAEPRAWRLRGMAVDTSRQRGGIGRAVLAAAVEAADAAGAPLTWANGRVSALPFYAANGWVALGAEFVTDTGIPHRKIVRRLT